MGTANILKLFDPFAEEAESSVPIKRTPPSSSSSPSLSLPRRNEENWELYATKYIKIYYTSKLIRNNTKLQLVLNMATASNRKSKSSSTLYDIDFCITIPDEVEIKVPKSGKDDFSITNENDKLYLHLTRLSSHTKRQKLEINWFGNLKAIEFPTSLKYSKDKYKGEKKNHKAKIYIGWSSLMRRGQISIDQMAKIMQNAIVNKLASKWIKLPKHSITEALQLVKCCINVALVEAVNYT